MIKDLPSSKKNTFLTPEFIPQLSDSSSSESCSDSSASDSESDRSIVKKKKTNIIKKLDVTKIEDSAKGNKTNISFDEDVTDGSLIKFMNDTDVSTLNNKRNDVIQKLNSQIQLLERQLEFITKHNENITKQNKTYFF